MKSLFVIILALSFFFTPLPATADKEGKQGKKGPHPSEKAYERASDKARFKRDEGWPAKAGKENEERERHRQEKNRGADAQDGMDEGEALSDSGKEKKKTEKTRQREEKEAGKKDNKYKNKDSN